MANGENGIFATEGGEPYFTPNATVTDNLDTNEWFQNLGRVRLYIDSCAGNCHNADTLLAQNKPRSHTAARRGPISSSRQARQHVTRAGVQRARPSCRARSCTY